MRIELIQPAATLAVAQLHRTNPDGAVSREDMRSAFLEAYKVLEEAEEAMSDGSSFWEKT